MGETKKAAKERERQEAIERLRQWLPPGTQVWTIIRHVSRSGMSCSIGLYAFKTDSHTRLAGKDRNIECPNPVDAYTMGYNAALALGWPYDRRHEGIRVAGCGMDMTFHVVYELSHVLHGDGYALIRERL